MNSIWSYCQENDIKPYKVLEGHKYKVQAAFFSPDGKFIISHGWDNTVKLWDVETGEKKQQVQLSPYNAPTKGLIPELDGEIANSVYSVSFSPHGENLAVASADKLLRIWDLKNTRYIDSLDGQHPTNWVWCRYSPDGKYLIGISNASGKVDGVKVIWDTETYKQTGRIVMSGKILFTEDSKYLVSGGWDNSVRLWDVSTSKQIWKYESDCYFLSCCISPDGKYLAAPSRDETIKIWDLKKIISF